MPVIIQSKKTATDIENVRSEVTAAAAEANTALEAHKTAYNAKVADIDAAAAALTGRVAAQESKQEADKVAAKAEHDARVAAVDATISEFQTNYASHLANFDAEKALRNAQKADLEASIADNDAKFEAEKARVETREQAVQNSLSSLATQAVSNKTELENTIALEKLALESSIAALASSTSGESGALTARISELERITGDDLKDTVNSVLTEEVVKTTLDSFLAKDEELSTAVNNAVAERVTMDNAIKAKFDLLVSKLFEGLDISGVTQAELSFGAPPLTSGIKLPDGSFVASVDDIVLSEWEIHYENKVEAPIQVVKKGSHIVWIYATSDAHNFYLVVTDETTGEKTDSGFNGRSEMNNHITAEAIRDDWTYTGPADIAYNLNYTVNKV